MKTNTLPLAGWLAVSMACLLGCQSAKKPGSTSHAAVQIQGHSLEEIGQVTAAVFREAEYVQTTASAEDMVFERPGSRRDALKWGGWEGAGVTMRVKVRATRMLDGRYLVTADVYAVQNSSDAFFRTESRVVMANRRPYQKLLDKVAKRLT